MLEYIFFFNPGNRTKREIPYRSGYQFHNGIDIAGSYGSPIRAASGGKVTFSGRRGSLGNLLIIGHANGYETYTKVHQ